MASLHVSVPHKLTQDEALKRIKSFISTAKTQFGGQVQAEGIKEEWNGYDCSFAFSAKGVSLAGTIEIAPDHVTLQSKLPMAAMFFKGKLEGALTDGLQTILK